MKRKLLIEIKWRYITEGPMGTYGPKTCIEGIHLSELCIETHLGKSIWIQFQLWSHTHEPNQQVRNLLELLKEQKIGQVADTQIGQPITNLSRRIDVVYSTERPDHDYCEYAVKTGIAIQRRLAINNPSQLTRFTITQTTNVLHKGEWKSYADYLAQKHVPF